MTEGPLCGPALRANTFECCLLVSSRRRLGFSVTLAPHFVRTIRASAARELALFDLGIDSKLRACDLVELRVRDVCHGEI